MDHGHISLLLRCLLAKRFTHSDILMLQLLLHLNLINSYSPFSHVLYTRHG